MANSRSMPFVARQDWLALGVLLISCFLAWSAANSKWSLEDWQLPPTYVHDPERGDFFANAAQLKASAAWGGVPFLRKRFRILEHLTMQTGMTSHHWMKSFSRFRSC